MTNNQESRIVKFTTHSFKKKVLLKHKQNKRNDTDKRKQNPKLKCRFQLNVQPSLSRFRIELLKKANEASEDNENFKFAYADMHGNLKFILNNPLNGKYVNHFRNENDIIDDIWYLHTVRKTNSDLFFRSLLYVSKMWFFLFVSYFSSFVEVLIFISLRKPRKMN